jgi:ATP-dependent Clp protease adaptor protein ClpS
MMSDTTTLPEPLVRPKEAEKVRRQPPYNVILLNDNDHTFDYVIRMLKELFGYPETKGFKLAEQVHTTGRAVVCTTTREHAELKQDQIHAYGPDPGIPRCKGSMTAVIEPAPG